MRRQVLLLAALAALTSIAAAQPVAVAIDAGRTGQPISKLILGGFIEPATTRLWAEMLYDRKFLYDINSQPLPPQPLTIFLETPRNPWRPIGGDEFVAMDKQRPWAGEHSPAVKVAGAAPHGIRQSNLVLRSGKAYTGRVILAGDPGVKVEVSLVWGANPADRQTVPISSLSSSYAKFPLKFTSQADSADGRLEITGTGAGSFHIGAVSLMPADNVQGYHPGIIKYIKEAGISLLRWPGGNFVSAYDWRDGLGDPDKRPSRVDPVWGPLETNDVGIDEFMTLCRLVNTEPYIAANDGFGEAHGAGEEVEYVNGAATTPMGRLRAANGHPQPYNVKIWGVGNEMYGPWQFGYMSLDQYWVKHIYFVQAMKKVDPTIKGVAVGATPDEMVWDGAAPKQDWDGGLLAHAADYIDYLAEHFYAAPDFAFDPVTRRFVPSHDPMEVAVRRLPNKLACKFEAWEEYLKKMPSLKDKHIQFAMDEWSNRRDGGGPGADPFPMGLMRETLSNALNYHEMFRHSDMMALSVYTCGLLTVIADKTGDGVGLYPEGLLMKLFREHFADRLPVAVSGNSPQRQIPGTAGVDTSKTPSGSPTYPLDVMAALSPDRKILTVSVVNPTESAQELELKIAGVKPSGAGKLWRLAASKLVESPVSQTPARVSVPPASISVYELPLRGAV